MKPRIAAVTAIAAVLAGILAPPARATGTGLTVSVTLGGAAVEGAFVAVTGAAGHHAALTDSSGQAVIGVIDNGTYAVSASAPGTTVGSTSVDFTGADIETPIALSDSGNKFDGLGAFGAQTSAILADGTPGVFYLTTTAVPSLYRTANYGGSWAPVTISADDSDQGISSATSANGATTSGFPGEIVTVVGNELWYSRDYGVTWSSVSLGGSMGMGWRLYWAHVGDTSILLAADESGASNAMAWTAMPTDAAPAVVPSLSPMSAPYKQAAGDRIWVAKGAAAPFVGVAHHDPETGTSVTLYEIDASPSNTDASSTVAGAAPDGTPTFVRIGGPATGPTIGAGAAPNTVVVYSNEDDAAVMSSYGSGSWTSTTTTVFHNQENDAVNSSGSFGNGPSSCGGQPGAIGSISPLGGNATVASCWLTQDGTTLHVRPVQNINNNTGMAFDAGYDGVDDLVLISGDGNYGAVKSATMNGTLNRPSFPGWPTLASAGVDPSSGGVSVQGVDAAVVKDTAFGPSGADQVAVMLSFSGGGRTLASVDGGETWITIDKRGGSSIDWWTAAAGGMSWILAGSSGGGNILSAADVVDDAFAPEDIPEYALRETLEGPAGLDGTSTADLGMGNPGSGGEVSAIVGIPGTDIAYVGTGTQDGSDGSLRKVTLSGSRSTVPDSRAATISGTGLTSVTKSVSALAYCPAEDTNAASVRDTVFAAIASSSGGIAVVSNASTSNPTLTMADAASTGTTLTGDFNEVRVDCVAGEVWAGRAGQGSSALIVSKDGGATFSAVTIAGTSDGQPISSDFQEIETLEVNADDPDEMIIVSSDGNVAVSGDGGKTWLETNDVSDDDGRSFGGEKAGDVEIPPTDGVVASGARRRATASTVSSSEALLGSGSGLFSASVLDDTAPSTPSMTSEPMFQAGKTFSIGWSTAADLDSGINSYVVSYRKAKLNATSYTSYPSWKTTTSRTASFTGSSGYRYCFKVRAKNGVGLLGSNSAEKCTAIPANNTNMTHSSGWTKKTASGYYLSTYSQSTTKGAYLTYPVRSAGAMSLIATKCSTCGTVSVYHGTTLLKRISLYSSTTKKKQVIPIVTSGSRTGTIKIKVYSSGKTVRIEGLAANRT